MSTISGVSDTASSLLTMLQERAATETETDSAGDGKGTKTVAVPTNPPKQGASVMTDQFASALLSELVQMQEQSTTAGSSVAGQTTPGQQLFAALDANGDGQVSQTEFESALTSAGADSAAADAIFKKLDANGDGTVSQAELASGIHGHHHHHHHHSAAPAADAADAQNPLALLLEADAASTTADGSLTSTAPSTV